MYGLINAFATQIFFTVFKYNISFNVTRKELKISPIVKFYQKY